MKLLKYVIGAALLIGLIVFVEMTIGWSQAFAPWKTLSYPALGLAILLVFISYGLRALRLYLQFQPQLRGHFWVCLKLMLQHTLLNNLLPMRSGEASFPILMQRYFQIPIATSVPTLFWFRLLDLLSILLLASISLGILVWGLAWSVGITGGIVILFLLSFHLQRPLLKSVSARLPEKHQGLLTMVEAGLPSSYTVFLSTTLWTFVNWLVKLAAFCWVLTQFIELDFATALLGSIGGEITSILPIHGIAGAGTYEAGIVAALSLVKAPINDALIGAVNVHLFLLSCSLLGGLLSPLIPSPRPVDSE